MCNCTVRKKCKQLCFCVPANLSLCLLLKLLFLCRHALLHVVCLAFLYMSDKTLDRKELE